MPQFLTWVPFITMVSGSDSAQEEPDRTHQTPLLLNQADGACNHPHSLGHIAGQAREHQGQ